MSAELSPAHTYSAQALWSLLDQKDIGLAAMREAMGRGDHAAAEAAYVRFQRQREAPVLPWIHRMGEGWETRSAAFDFLNEIPDTLSWQDKRAELVSREKGYTSHRLEGLKPSPYNVVELADLQLENRVILVYHPEDGVQDLGPKWDWEHVPSGDGQGRRWTLSLPYQYFLFALAQAYWATDNERYIAKLVWIYKHYCDYVDSRSDWIWLPDMQLARCYLQLMPFILSWKDLLPRDFCRLRYWLATTCMHSMEGVDSAPGNQLLYNGLGILWLGVGMPEFAHSAAWRKRGWEQISGYFGEGAFYSDGTSKENSFGYIIGSSESAIEAVNLARDNGWPYPEAVEIAMVKRAEFLADAMKPDGTCPWIGDSQRRSPKNYVGHIAATRGRDDLEYAISAGEKGSHPDHTSSWYAWQGLAVMRSDWASTANYLMFDVGPLGTVHAHEGKLAIEVVAYGRSLIEDLGIHSYSRESPEIPYYNLFGNTPGHNTVVVDGASQMRLVNGAKTVDEPLANLWESGQFCDYLSGTYEDGWGPGQFGEPMRSAFPPEDYDGPIDSSIVHHRSVIYVKGVEPDDCEYWVVTDRLIGSGDHTYEQLFHLIPLALEYDEQMRCVYTASEGEANIAIISVSPADVDVRVVEGQSDPEKQGWYCGQDSQPVPAPCVIFRQQGEPPAFFQTVLWPQRPGDGWLPRVETESQNGSGWLRVCRPDGAEDVLCVADGHGSHELGDLSFEGVAVLVRFDQEGAPVQWEVIGGEVVCWQGKELVADTDE